MLEYRLTIPSIVPNVPGDIAPLAGTNFLEPESMRPKPATHRSTSGMRPWSATSFMFAGADQDDELVKFVEDQNDADGEPGRSAVPLVVLVVDDDHDVHDSTQIALAGTKILGRPVEIVHAYSAEQARMVFAANHAIALVLLDVVMETQDAGIRFLAELRDTIDRRDVRVIIRTGQPGYLPEGRFQNDQSVSGFLLKSRLTRSMLLDAMTSAMAPRGGSAAS
jgi:CheY-like chemotaxis protein